MPEIQEDDAVAKPAELYFAAGCPYSVAAREDLEWRGVDFVEYDVEKDRDAYERMLELTGGNRTVPVIHPRRPHGAIFADQISPHDPFASFGTPLQPPSLAHPMGGPTTSDGTC